MSQELKSCFDRVVASHTAATAHYQIWFTLRGKGKALETYYGDMNDRRYVDFFHAANSGNYKLMFIEAASLFDSDERAASIRKLKQLLSREGFGCISNEFDEKLRQYFNLVSNIKIIRSKIIAHKDIDTNPEDLYKKYGIIPNDIRDLLDVCGGLLQKAERAIANNYSGSFVCTTNRFERATYSILEALHNGRNSGTKKPQ
ncbi:hypothetical protein FKG94_28310 [Exilibacterium tricleocarpae]|uniref:HEPN AbiU2-like domain-containing protein n=1 Tax=Exilibacterium tricleocarpae TaxID=2591008 RepID=A0A545SL37_9GAMM|nr:hypothetical protein [Exilibacterium tricleocarpae]TQV65681.1 hypothetical protein FKG94_28310 [Exilibacterium tricleocarpae]